MFDIGFWELVVIGVVTLLVVGPERLPKVARTAGKWIGKARRMVSSMKAEIDRELAAEELKQILAKQAEANPLHQIIEETQKAGEGLKGFLDEAAGTTPAPPPPTAPGTGPGQGGALGGGSGTPPTPGAS